MNKDAVMTKDEVCQRIRDIGVIPAIRVSSAEEAHFAADTVCRGGIPIVEITMTVPEAVELITHLVRHHRKVIVGAGTVLNVEVAKKCIDAGANFVTAPGFNAAVVEFAIENKVAVLPGAFTPSEVINAWQAGADFVKVFPCGIGGEKYIKALNTALPEIPLIAAGGVTQHTATNYILAGATAIGVGAELIPSDALACRETERIEELARRFVTFVNSARQRLSPAAEVAAATKTDFNKLHKRPVLEKSGDKQ
jgi:2-dehydro-3-deoxyphosphogluconate aldolase/(4S)-4-hydroxy-2-oxoglutarate aldolase